MIFKDKLDEKRDILHSEFEKLFELAIKNQSHGSDLLLIGLHGFYNEDRLNTSINGLRFNPHVIGPGFLGLSEDTHFKFIDKYRQSNIQPITFSEYKGLIEYSPEKLDFIYKATEDESLSIQVEMLIYLKIWEADLFIKNLYQLVRILNGEPYDWYFKVAESARKTNDGTRQDIIRKEIRDKLKNFSTPIYKEIKAAYITQVRNSISHSNYSFSSRFIQLNNEIEGDKYSQRIAVSFDEWIDIFHSTLMIHNEYIWLKNKILSHFSSLVTQGVPLSVRIVEMDGSTYELPLKFNDHNNQWRFKNSEDNLL